MVSIHPLMRSSHLGSPIVSLNCWAVFISIMGTPIPMLGLKPENLGANKPGVFAYSKHLVNTLLALSAASMSPLAFA